MQLERKTAVVTGGAVRLGRAISLALAEAGMNVCVHFAHSATAADGVVDLIRSQGKKATCVQADFRAPVAAAGAVIDHACEQFGRVDVLVNSAAIFEPGNIGDTTEEVWDGHLDVNLKAPFFLCRAFAMAKRPADRGHIVNIADWRGTKPGADYLAYTVAKSGLIALTRSLAQALAPDIQVNAIAPGAILPPAGQPQEDFQRLANRIPLKRTGSAGDVTDALLFLLQSDFVTGEILHVTGGEELA